MADPLQRMRQLCEAIANTRFQGPGAFTNAFLSNTKITALLRDSVPGEKGLYKVTKGAGVASSMIRRRRKKGRRQDDENTGPAFVELKHVRVDGRSVFLDHAFSLSGRKAVHVPRLTPANAHTPDPWSSSETHSSPTRRRRTPQHRTAPQDSGQNHDVPALCEAIEKMASQLPGASGALALRNKALKGREDYYKLTHEIANLTHTVAQHKQHLERHHDSRPELLPVRGGLSPSKTLSVDEMIRREEERILQLERELEATAADPGHPGDHVRAQM
ncbi:hypothetical protein METBIDRAFT_13506 [Metschnikowia bicuspidata var. bicuspidata NRRL YB-4993]|uniref:DASH complex subunit SPC34 n=1 Tax=Metschnikowia bicuspidata var. bicuspidata NRRL YB-4993 TaxID=869754 RepID=A0A1A0H589_9ASCO|nr:hypothetical protein METBIDRAFT_13506 [Metschnikowia bicuspidata var. bicuspidata NRRL YB-4993]OBA19201.1 hypothetical protein METBIDRAFT_13506 [Metschnikowia bicuspidata var. bicuspidata NRRL YB-4993]